MTELEQYIQSYFGIASPMDMEKIVSLFNVTQLEKGDYYVKAGRYCDKLSFIQSGLLRVYADAGQKEITQWISTKGYFITDLSSLVFHTPARRNIQALTDATLFTIEREDYIRLKTLVPQWTELEKLFIARCFIILEDRIFSHLSLSAEERYQQLFASNRELSNQVPLHYLASMLGMTPETFSRIRKKTLQ
jgi:CRP-like cAMP-binding protein